MFGINVAAVLVAVAASVVASMVWYSVVGGSMAQLQQQWRGAAAGSDRMIWTLLAFATTSLVIATAVAMLFRLTGTTGLLLSVGLGLLLWIGFCATPVGRIHHRRGCPDHTRRDSCRRPATPHGDHVRNHRSLALRGGAKHEPVLLEGEVVLGAAVRDRT